MPEWLQVWLPDNPAVWIVWIAIGTVLIGCFVGLLLAVTKAKRTDAKGRRLSRKAKTSQPSSYEADSSSPRKSQNQRVPKAIKEPESERIIRLLAEYSLRADTGLAEALRVLRSNSTSGVYEGVSVFGGTDMVVPFLAMRHPRWPHTKTVACSFLKELSYIKWQKQPLQYDGEQRPKVGRFNLVYGATRLKGVRRPALFMEERTIFIDIADREQIIGHINAHITAIGKSPLEPCVLQLCERHERLA